MPKIKDNLQNILWELFQKIVSTSGLIGQVTQQSVKDYDRKVTSSRLTAGRVAVLSSDFVTYASCIFCA